MASLKQDYWQSYVYGNWVDGGAGRLTVEPGNQRASGRDRARRSRRYRPRSEGGARLS